MYMSEYNHTIDQKGRLIIPSKFRESSGYAFVVTKGLDGCLFAYDYTGWTGFEEKLKDLPMNNPNTRQVVRFFLAGASEIEIDKQGRALIPQNLREYAGLSKDVVLIGAGNRFEIWDREKWNTYSAGDDVEANVEAMADLGCIF